MRNDGRGVGALAGTVGGTVSLALALGLAVGAVAPLHGQGRQVAENGASITIPAGTEIVVRLDEPLSTETHARGDRWTGTVSVPVTDGDRVLIDRGAVVRGEVTEAGPVRVEGDKRQVLAVEPETIVIEGRDYPLRAEVIDADVHEHDEKFTGENIAIIGASAAGGALLGALLGDEDEALLGALLGGAAGTVVAVATEETEIELHEGTELTLELEENLNVER